MLHRRKRLRGGLLGRKALLEQRNLHRNLETDARLLHQRETFRKHLGRSFHRKPGIRKGHGEMRLLRHRNAKQMQPACGWRQGYG